MHHKQQEVCHLTQNFFGKIRNLRQLFLTHARTVDTVGLIKGRKSNRNRTPALKFICTGSTDSGRNHCNVGVGRKADTWGICGRCVRALSLYWIHFVSSSFCLWDLFLRSSRYFDAVMCGSSIGALPGVQLVSRMAVYSEQVRGTVNFISYMFSIDYALSMVVSWSCYVQRYGIVQRINMHHL